MDRIRFRTGLDSLPLLLLFAACGGASDALDEANRANSSADNAHFRYYREYVFIAPSGEEPLVVPFNFSSTEIGEEIQRGVRGWLARGPAWDRFLDETERASSAGGVWRVVPQADLRITAGGSTQLETLHFQQNERQLRLEFEEPLTEWQQGGETRFRLLRGRLSIGAEMISGPILELLRVERTLEDGWPPGQDFDSLFLTSGDSIQLLLAETLSGDRQGEGHAWIRTRGSERVWNDGELRWLSVQPYENARRDIPTGWSFRVPGAAVIGEVEAVGFDTLLGPERGGRRAVEIRYSVRGWMEIQGMRREVFGTIRHTQQ